jgi:hypothetical protein
LCSKTREGAWIAADSEELIAHLEAWPLVFLEVNLQAFFWEKVTCKHTAMGVGQQPWWRIDGVLVGVDNVVVVVVVAAAAAAAVADVVA